MARAVVNIEVSEESKNLKIGEKHRSGIDDLRQSDVGRLNCWWYYRVKTSGLFRSSEIGLSLSWAPPPINHLINLIWV